MANLFSFPNPVNEKAAWAAQNLVAPRLGPKRPVPGPPKRFGQGLGAGMDLALITTWWRALTDYVAQMQAAWFTFASFGRRDHPGLNVIFAMLAGCAPLRSERLKTRGGPAIDLRDPRIFYETSSYGPAAVDMMARRAGETQLLYGSDRPVIEPKTTGRDARRQHDGATLFARTVAAA